jgi:acyl-CoA thioesterase
MTQGGKPLLKAQSWITADNLGGLEHDFSRPPHVPSPAMLPRFQGWSGAEEEELSPIWRHIERRPASSYAKQGLPGSVAEWVSWLRLTSDLPSEPVIQSARAIMWLDLAPWNAILASHEWPIHHIAPTIDLTVQFQGHMYDHEVVACDWLLVKVESPVAGGGLVGTQSSLWSQGGTLVAAGTAQCLSIPRRHGSFVDGSQ